MKKRMQEFTYDMDSVLVTRPTYIIEVILAVASFLFGAYVSSPIFRPSNPTPEANTYAGSFTIRFISSLILFFLPALITFLSIFFWRLKSNIWRRRASFCQFCGWFFIAMLQLINNGFYPVTWLMTLTLGIIAAVCHFSTRAEMSLENNARH